MSWLVLEKGKPVEGAIFSQPCRAEPVKFDILCMVRCAERPGEMAGGAVGEETGNEDESSADESKSHQPSIQQGEHGGRPLAAGTHRTNPDQTTPQTTAKRSLCADL